jgi:hypothetical protein
VLAGFIVWLARHAVPPDQRSHHRRWVADFLRGGGTDPDRFIRAQCEPHSRRTAVAALRLLRQYLRESGSRSGPPWSHLPAELDSAELVHD